MKKATLFLAAVLVISLGYSFFRTTSVLTVSIKGQTLSVERADTPEKRQVGLMNRDRLNDDEGMLFFFPEETAVSFWMKNTLIPLDMIFISADKKINHIEKNVPPCATVNQVACPTYSSPYPTQYVLEVNGGYSDLHQIQEGDQVEF